MSRKKGKPPRPPFDADTFARLVAMKCRDHADTLLPPGVEAELAVVVRVIDADADRLWTVPVSFMLDNGMEAIETVALLQEGINVITHPEAVASDITTGDSGQ